MFLSSTRITTMEGASQPLPVESFSYSWLVNFPMSQETYEDPSSFIEMDPKLTPSKRFLQTNPDQDYQCSNFDFRVSEATLEDDLAHADELFSNGFVVPLFVGQSNIIKSPGSPIRRSLHEYSNKNSFSSSFFPRKRRRRSLSKRLMVLKYLDFLTPLYQKISGRGGRDRKSGNALKSRIFSEDSASSVGVVDAYWRRSCDSESSIYEAVLHCKKSIGKLS